MTPTAPLTVLANPARAFADGVILATGGQQLHFALDGVPSRDSVRVSVAGRAIPHDPARRNGFAFALVNGSASVILLGSARPAAGDPIQIEYRYVQR